MRNAQILWNGLPEKTASFNKQDWYAWLSYGMNGRVIETDDDQVQYLNDHLKKAVRITYEKDGRYEYTYFFSDFNDHEIEFLNICTNNIQTAQTRLDGTITDWLNGILPDCG